MDRREQRQSAALVNPKNTLVKNKPREWSVSSSRTGAMRQGVHHEGNISQRHRIYHPSCGEQE